MQYVVGLPPVPWWVEVVAYDRESCSFRQVREAANLFRERGEFLRLRPPILHNHKTCGGVPFLEPSPLLKVEYRDPPRLKTRAKLKLRVGWQRHPG